MMRSASLDIEITLGSENSLSYFPLAEMRIPAFEIRNQRSVTFAKCDDVPPLMIITGPNGAGKSTLLYSLRHINGRERILYIGPHRSTRRQNVHQRHLIAQTIDVEKMLCRDDAPRFDGIDVALGSRDPWNGDDSLNFLKHSLCQIEIERTEAIARRYERDGEILRGSLPDPWEPLRELTGSLLPHLTFSKIDTSNRERIRCLWHVHSRNEEVDLDDLSSGEKSIIQMFYPLLEHRIRGILTGIGSNQAEEVRPEICILIDEPELHLHPNLQVKVFDYLRLLTAEGRTQVAFVSHSPTIVEHASSDELFLLRPVELVSPGENQLIRIADNEAKLRLIREVFGTTSNVTAMQPIVIVEGVVQTSTSTTISDRKLYRALCRNFDTVTVIPGGGRAECIKLLRALERLIPELSEKMKVVALIDSDTTEGVVDSNVHLLPVSMIENFFLDPIALWESIQSVIEKTGISTIDEITNALDSLLDDFEEEEITRRSKAALGNYLFRPASPISSISTQAEEASKEILDKYSSSSVAAALSAAKTRVAELSYQKRRREQFHGKDVLDAFYRKYLSQSGLAKNVFKYEVARHAKERKAVIQFFESFFAKLFEDA